VKARVIGWLSLLLLVSSAFGVPVSRAPVGVTIGVCAQIVCEHRERRPEPVTPPRVVLPPVSFVPGSAVDSEVAALLDHSLFHRPPPAA
jgi:hypothetical protein